MYATSFGPRPSSLPVTSCT